MQRHEYKSVFAISQSAIKAFKTKTLQKFKRIYIDKEEDDDEDQDKFALGSMVDTIAFEPKLINERFYIVAKEIAIPGEKVKVIVDRSYKEARLVHETQVKLNEIGNLPEPIYIRDISDIYEWKDIILEKAREISFGGDAKPWSDKRILDTVYQDANAYFRELSQANGRAIITNQDNTSAIAMVDALKNGKDTAAYFTQQENETLLHQKEIFVEYELEGRKTPLPLKGALDIIRFNHKEKWVIVPDLKTTYSSEHFVGQVKSYDYLCQVSFYDFLLTEFLKKFSGGRYAKYERRNPINIAIDPNYKVPFIYEYDWEDIEISREGSKEKNSRGWMKALQDIAWHIDNKVWDRPRELAETGKIKIKIF